MLEYNLSLMVNNATDIRSGRSSPESSVDTGLLMLIQ